MRDMRGVPCVALCTPPVINVPWQFVETFRFYDVDALENALEIFSILGCAGA